ncbi:MAG: hypothetical protein COW65_14630 [Cytophagales bacterium CG18_big_fil_WC_8_21_14_2_50_42_9]|nr:MAG: hypothetical protein COW65_14630 [Cytophagales bacterium CG18_big_fil_WC_8_21_14_2_50_42_9]
MFKSPFSFNGRIGRKEYRFSFIIYIIAVLAIGFFIQWDRIRLTPFKAFIFYLPFAWFFLAQGAKRCHDRNNTGFYQFIPLYVLFMLFADGNVGANDFGADPKGRVKIDYII